MAGLTNKQQAFVEAYLANGFNATKAAIAAGYSEKTARFTASENLTKPNIAEFVKQRMAQLTMTADEALFRLSEHARGDMAEFATITPEELADHPQSRLVKEIERTTTIRRNRKGDEETETERFRVKLYDAQTAQLAIIKEQHLRAGEATERSDLTTLGERLAAPMVYLPSVDDADD